MATERVKLSTNQTVTVLDEVNGCYVVEYEGQIGYMKTDMVSANQIVDTPAYNGGNNGGSDNSGSTWTPPRL